MKAEPHVKSCCLPSPTASVHTQAISGIKCDTNATPSELIPLDGGWFRMGAEDGPHPEDGEGPERDVFVDSFSLAPTTVSIKEFAQFVEATGYLSRAEQLGTSFVFYAFTEQNKAYPAVAQATWWRQVPGACWHAPDGPHSDVSERENHPVTHIALQDASAYCQWSGTRLPSEAEWEFAARGGLEAKPYPWGEELLPGGQHRSNLWQGHFPDINTGDDGHLGTAEVSAYPANPYGFYNMTGNVWEWTSDRFTTLHTPRPTRNPIGPLNGKARVAKGGSYLCHASYCARYRTSSRQALSPDTTTGNLGFRVAAD